MSTNPELHDGRLYLPNDAALEKQQFQYLDQLYDFNQTRPSELTKRQILLTQMFAEIGSNCYIEPPLHSNWGGHHVHFGAGVYANFNLTLVDDTHIYVGDHTMFGPNVTLATAGHPLLPELREQGYQYNAPIHIGKNCWFGAGVIVVPGITIGDNVVIGAGSVVTKDLPDNVIAVGDPAKVLRSINDHDRQYYFKDRQIDPELLKRV
ncbi:sugar O-acetyltransferase [Lactiplantibacillus fabifermentans]|uniref:Acetyltransferase n=2 Tax=Lactiplantibacillus fabifermentans TaxID=483011 RepID=A0A0R2NGX4_9LACO|nr:sugar O-acetyltransferase [Lactiplantibacillus fabifermentans]ETY75391.1 maltose O-acetyltransferase [Lactiplantibacillus fabifermentans T30PCM01]KRO25071.1 galactoside O-acetyltransferase [Lactiplantibacillus fabifermentans DSM 21115]